MTLMRLMTTAGMGALAGALLFGSIPAAAQDEQPNRGERAQRAERPRISEDRGGERREMRMPDQAQRAEVARARAQVNARAAETAQPRVYGGERSASQAPSQRGGRDWSAQRQARDAARAAGGTATQPDGRRTDGNRTGWGNRSDASPSTGWQRDPSYGARSREWQRDRREDARRDERRDDARNYNNGYRDGRRDDNRRDGRWDNRGDWRNDGRNEWRNGQNYRRWDNRSWRNDSRYDWSRYRAANRSLFSLGRYYAPYRNYSYSRVSIGIRLGSPFYANRYWINDPWRYRLPEVYGPYRWIRYYDDALLVDVYSGEVVDVIHNFFW